MNIFLIGTGMGNSDNLTVGANEKIKNADIIIGAKRITQAYKQLGKMVVFEYDAEKIAKILNGGGYENAVVLFSGDISFFSGAKKLREMLPNASVETGVSCISYFCAKIGQTYDDMNIVSMHGRECNIVSEVRRSKKTFVLLGENPCEKLCRYGLGETKICIGENLSYKNEKISCGLANEFRDTKISELSVMVIINENACSAVRYGIQDDEFITGKPPMTKSEARAISLSKLEIKDTDICYDIGAGTGSVSVEMALACHKGKVYAIEKDSDSAEYIERNAVKFMTDNIEIICKEATEVIDSLPKADKVFIGGSSGRIADIIEKCNCSLVVVNAITLETLSGTLKTFDDFGYEYEVTQISAARGKKVGEYNMMMAQNPVFVIRGEKK